MNSQFNLGTRLSLALSLAISSFLVANAAQATTHTNSASIDQLNQTISTLMDLDPIRQDLLKSALNRAIASRAMNTVGTVVSPNQQQSEDGMYIRKPRQIPEKPVLSGEIRGKVPDIKIISPRTAGITVAPNRQR